MTKIESIMLDTITGGALGLTTGTPARRSGSSSNVQLQTALTGVTSALDSLKSNQNNSTNSMLPLVIMAKWMQNR